MVLTCILFYSCSPSSSYRPSRIQVCRSKQGQGKVSSGDDYNTCDMLTSGSYSLYFVGKGVTYDTGGADIKCSGHMRGKQKEI